MLVGGLGLGHTADAALACSGVSSVTVVERLPAVLRWHREGLVPLATRLTGDGRCRLVEGDVFEVLATGADHGDGGGPWDAILVDVDHAPDSLLVADHGRFYTTDGFTRCRRCLAPGGVLALWSAEPADPAFTAQLAAVFDGAVGADCTYDHPLLGREDTDSIYLAWVDGAD